MIAAWVPDDFWHTFFLADHPLATKLIGALLGPLVAIATFVRSIGGTWHGPKASATRAICHTA